MNVVMAEIGSDILPETLARRGIDVICGLPGGGIQRVIESRRACQDRFRLIVGPRQAGAVQDS